MEFLPFTLGPLFFTICMGIAMLAVILYDIRHYIIPNALNGALIALYGLAAFFLQLDVLAALIAAGVMLVAGIAVFAFRLMGGGDVKLLIALSLWVGWSESLLEFVVLTAVMGGVLAVSCLVLRATLGRMWHTLAKHMPRPRILLPGESIPYGIAIAAAFLIMMAQGGITGLTPLF